MKKLLFIFVLCLYFSLQGCFFGGDVNDNHPGDDFVVNWQLLREDFKTARQSLFKVIHTFVYRQQIKK